ncbi:helix-turn-helix domain-containing protein [Selenomonas ruminantium]|uniref:Transcriptional regulator, contains XRE-family HTH domain n=1 Tax=Selenomonas ruminantium TaxID=971 RepID=A0A1H0M6V0_SELRU|nr:helix-turn-helix domain-containing protein [Selenomonas ruminantium]SDO75830.1 Transcriptional regulator, contains XRE-family HTH domain [Selenomonas ruminantium]
MIDIDKKLLEWRELHGYKQQQVADALGVSRATYANYECGRRSPDIKGLIRLAEFYGISLDELVGYDNNGSEGTSLAPQDKQLLKQYRRLTDEGRERISNQIECELRIDAEAAAKRREKQRQGIEAAQKAGVQYGRPKVALPQNWNTVYAQWKAQDITADEAAVKLGISKATLYRMVKRVKQN